MQHPIDERGDETGLQGGLLIFLGPILLLVAFTTFLAVLASLSGWHRPEMLMIAAALGAATLLASVVTVILLYRQVAGRTVASRALRIAEARVSGILESAMDAIISIGEDQRVVLYNEAAEKLFQWPRTAVLGQPLDRLIPMRFRAAHAGHIGHFGDTGVTSRRMGDQTVLVGLRANGEEFPIEASISQHSENGSKLFTVILRDVTVRVTAVNALSRSREELREFAAAASSVREQEKSRIARELHDELAQALTALKMDLTWLGARLPAGQEPLAAKLESMQTMLNGTVAATRRIAADLRPLILDDLGLLPAVEWLVQGFCSRTGVACDLNVSRSDFELPEPYATAVFRILQESLTNAARHAQASLVEVTLGREDGAVLLTVNDNGSGFAVEDPRKPHSYGLMGLRERVYLLDGEVTIESRPGAGTRITVHIPIISPAPTPTPTAPAPASDPLPEASA